MVYKTKACKFTVYQPIILYRKLTATRIFNGYQFLPKDSVLLVDENGVIIDIVPTSEAGSDIEFFEGTLSPGFINCHCHLELSHLKGKIEKNTGLIDFLGKIMVERNATDLEISTAIASAESEMLQNGIVAVGDICNNINTIPQKTKQQLYYHNFIEVAGFPVEMANTRFEKILEVYHQFKTHFSNTSIVPHAPYSVSTALLQKIVEYEENNLICIHNQETIEETDLYQKKSGGFADFYSRFNISMDSFVPKGKSSLQDILPQFKINQPLILVHNVFTEQADVEYAQSFYGDFYASLPISGISGTMKNFCKSEKAKGKIRAKSGTLTRTFCYSGYAQSKRGALVFSVMINSYSGNFKEMKSELEKILESLVEIQ